MKARMILHFALEFQGTWDVARDQLASIIEATTPATKKHGAGSKFRHQVTAEPAGPLPPRGFVFHLRKIAQKGATASPLPRRKRYAVDLEIAYPDNEVDATTLYALMAADHDSLTNRLPQGELWGRPASGIVNLFGAGDEILPGDIVIEK